MQELVIASNNMGKLKEIGDLFAPYGISLLPQASLGISDCSEPHPTFIENALAKARHASAHSGKAALADDSGLCVAALHGAPGVLSARYAGKPQSATRNNQKLLQALQGETHREAYFYCVMVLLRHPQDAQPIIAEGMWAGSIIDAPRGEAGFGYDPIFYDPRLGLSVAEMNADTKNTHSHRAQAVRNLLKKLSQ